MGTANQQEARNLEIVRRGYEAFAARDMETMKAIMAPNAHWHETRNKLFSGDFNGQQAILDYFGQLANATDNTITATPKTMVAEGDCVFVAYHLSAKRGGKTLETDNVNIFKLANGVVIDTLVYESDQPAVDAFYS
ncbi:MAG TPA: nuclear transport factor 2 family protein [Acidocella sp.]|nr:nuclear transport factor 2 family protein [Acidocella sp.]